MANSETMAAILSVVATEFLNHGKSMPRRSLVKRFRDGGPEAALSELLNANVLRRTALDNSEAYLPTSAAFQLSRDAGLIGTAKGAASIVLHGLHEMVMGEPVERNYSLEDLSRHLDEKYPHQLYEDTTLRLGLFLARDFGVLSAMTMNSPADTEVVSFRIGEAAITLKDIESKWDAVTAQFKVKGLGPPSGASDGTGSPPPVKRKVDWEYVAPLGGGGQSNVSLVRSPERVTERAKCIVDIVRAVSSGEGKVLAEATWMYARPELPSELGALKVFKIPPESKGGAPKPGTKHHRAVQRLKNEIKMLERGRPGLPRLLHSDVANRRIVTEYFPERSLDKNPVRYKGQVARALRAFRSVVQTVVDLHAENCVHRDIKPANIFVRSDDDLVLGDFGIVFVADQAERVTFVDERVGPRDFMPDWADRTERLENVESNIDIYELGKLLWCMVAGKPKLPREHFTKPEFDLTVQFPGNPDMYLINRILNHCVSEDPKKCISAGDLLSIVDVSLAALERGGQLIAAGVPRPCRVCGVGHYQVEKLATTHTSGSIRMWVGHAGGDTVRIPVQVLACDSCGHVEFFKHGPSKA